MKNVSREILNLENLSMTIKSVSNYFVYHQYIKTRSLNITLINKWLPDNDPW